MNMRLFTNQSSMMQPKVQNNLINQLIVNNSTTKCKIRL